MRFIEFGILFALLITVDTEARERNNGILSLRVQAVPFIQTKESSVMGIQRFTTQSRSSPTDSFTRKTYLVLAVVFISFVTMGIGYGYHGPIITLPDSQIKTAIVDRLRMDTRVDPSRMQVEVKQGHAVLSGLVESLEEKFLTEHIIATSIIGVNRITNNISVRPALTKDDMLEQKVLTQLKNIPVLSDLKLRVTVDDGIVKLEGTVPKPHFRKMAHQAVGAIPGIRKVDDFIKLAGPQRSDGDIQKDVGTYLQYSPFVHVEDIDYQVGKGVIIVKGVVEGMGILSLLARDLDKIDGVVQVDLTGIQVKVRPVKG